MSRRCFDPFRILSPEERARHLAGYGTYLRARDGEIDLPRRSLSRREAWFDELERKPVEWLGDLDREGFYAHYRDEGGPDVDQRTVWLIATAKANVGESYGVEIELSRFFRRSRAADEADPLYLHLMLEEHYHTRILESLCRTCGIEPERRLPSALQRAIIHLMMYLPERVRWVPILAGEVLGSEVFKMLREGTTLFEAQPEVETRLDSLLREIWTDEVFHIAYLRAKIGPWGVRVARRLLPLIAWSVMRDVPQLPRLGWTRQTVLARLRSGIEIPQGIDWMSPDGA